jgi:arylsulfatase A-like enzyme
MKLFRFNRFTPVLAAIAVLPAFSGWAQSLIINNSQPQAVPRRASIIIIQCDGLGYGDLSCDGQTNYQTPNLDQLAAEGIRFTNYFAADSSAVTRASLMLGKDYSTTRRDIPLAPEAVTVAQVLKMAGYQTGYIGEWDLGDENSLTAPWKKGFDDFIGFFNDQDAANFYAGQFYRYARRTLADPPQKAAHFVGYEELYYNTGGKHETYIPDMYGQAAANFVKENVPDAANHHRPFFLVVNYIIPDAHIQVPSDAPYSDESWPQAGKNRAALISRIDNSIALLRQQLDKVQMTNNVLIFFAGGSIPHKTAELDPAFFQSNLATNDFHVPMIVHWPNHIPAGQVSGLKWSAHDFLPTAVQIGYAPTPAGVDGTSILTELGGKPQ